MQIVQANDGTEGRKKDAIPTPLRSPRSVVYFTVAEAPMHRPGGSKHPPHEADWIWAESGAGPFCCEAQADGVPCFEVGRDCEECEKGREGWMRLKEARHTDRAGERFP